MNIKQMNIKKEAFSMNRFGLLVKRDLLSSYRAILIRIAAASGVLLFVDLMSLWQDGPDLFHHIEVFTAVLFVGGFIATSGAFREVHRKETNQSYLLIPASPLEKVISKIAFYTVGWIILTAVWYTLYILVVYGAGELLLGSHYPLHGPFHPQLLTVYAHYIVLQSIFLIGAIFFRRTNFFKTALAMFVLLLLLALIMAIFFRIVFASYFTGLCIFDVTAWEPFEAMFPYQFSGLMEIMNGVKNVVYWGILAPAAWVFTYFRFREVQVKDGI